MKNSNDQRMINKFLDTEMNIGSIRFKRIDYIYVLCLWSLALIVRVYLFPIVSADYFGFLEKWMEEIKRIGAWKSLGVRISNYSSMYMYLMSLVSGCDNSLYALKAVSVVFDYAASCAVFGIIYELTKNTKKAILGMSIVLLCPTSIIDSAYWCQCDVIYSSFILWSFYFFFKNKSRECFIFLGLAFSFKLQAVFILPFLIIMWLKNRTVKIYHLVYVPIVYFITCIPAWICGRPIKELLMVYFEQSDAYPWGTLQYPNVYALLDETIEASHWTGELTSGGTVFTIIVLGFVAYYMYSARCILTDEIILSIAMFTVALCVYFLPHMHDRYGFLIDMIAILYAIIRPKRLPLLCLIFFVTVMTFMPYLIAVNVMELRKVAFIQTGIIAYMGYDLYRLIMDNPISEDLKKQEPV